MCCLLVSEPNERAINMLRSLIKNYCTWRKNINILMEMCTAFYMRFSFCSPLLLTLALHLACVLYLCRLDRTRTNHLHLGPTHRRMCCSLSRYTHIQCNNFIGQLNPIERHQEEPNEAYSHNIGDMNCVYGSICIDKQ